MWAKNNARNYQMLFFKKYYERCNMLWNALKNSKKFCIIFYFDKIATEAWNEWVSKSKEAILHKITIVYLHAKVYQ